MGAGSGQDGITVVIADDHQILRDGLVSLLEALPGITVAGTAADGLEAVQVVKETTPDVIVMDIQMPHLDGIEATRRILVDQPGARVVMLTMNEDDQVIVAALRAGARGYLLKGANAAEVQRAIVTAAAGGTVLGAALAGRLADLLTAPVAPAAPAARPFPELTDRERSVLELLAAGRSNAEISRSTYLSDKTVRNIVSGIYAKLHVHDRAELIIQARDAGLGRRF